VDNSPRKSPFGRGIESGVEPAVLSQLQALAATQFSLFSAGQATALGVTRRALERALDRGWIVSVRRGVYALAGHPRSPWQPLMAAALAAGPPAVISHGSAAAVHGFYGFAPGRQTELSVPGKAHLALDGVTIHRMRNLLPEDVVERRGVRMTSAIRTIIDMAGTINDHLLARVIDEGAIRRLWTPDGIACRLDQLRGCGRPGVKRLDRLLAVRAGDPPPDSSLEQRVFRVLRPRVPQFVTHYPLTFGGKTWIVDLALLDFKIAGEVEGRDVRAVSRGAFDRGKLKANILVAHGWRLVYFISTMDDETIVEQVTALLPTGSY
jgi:hypothetical protein